MKNRICIYPIAFKCFFFGQLVSTIESIWPANRSLRCSSTCGYSGLLASSFGHPMEVSTQVQLVASWDYLRVQSFRVVVIYFVDFLRFQQHQSLAQSVKGSRYYQTIPPVQVECPLLDGDPSSIPIIFEDKYYFSEPREPGTYKPLCFGDFMPKFCNSR